MPVSVTEIFSVYLMKIMLNCYYFVVCTGCWRFYGKWIINLLNKKNSEINPSDFKSFINSIEFFMLIKIKTPPTKDPCHSFKNSYTEKNLCKKIRKWVEEVKASFGSLCFIRRVCLLLRWSDKHVSSSPKISMHSCMGISPWQDSNWWVKCHWSLVALLYKLKKSHFNPKIPSSCNLPYVSACSVVREQVLT